MRDLLKQKRKSHSEIKFFEIEKKSDSRFSSILSILDEEKIALKFILSQIDMNNGMREEKSEK